MSDPKQPDETAKRQELEMQRRQALKMEIVGQLASGIAHEFNNLLQAITGHTICALQGLDPQGKQHEDLQQVLQAAQRAAALAQELLGFSRRRTAEDKSLDPNKIVENVARFVRPLLGEHIVIDLARGDEVGRIDADPDELMQALLNLCLNARDAMPDGGKIVLATRRVAIDETDSRRLGCKAGDCVVISVTDTGTGIPPNVQDHIFEPFFTTKEAGKGTGLGLSIVQDIVKRYGGAINVGSMLGLGTTFTIILPVAEAA